MKNVGLWLRGLTLALCLGAAWNVLAENAASDSCEREASAVSADDTRRFLVLAASKGVFYDRSGPSFVMLMRMQTATDELEMGAVGIYADEKRRAVFGAVPWRAYDPFLREPAEKAGNVMLRLEISEAQYGRVLGILRDWQRRAREGELLYPNDIYMNNILLVKQATEALNRCGPNLDLYTLDWGVNDEISDNHPRSQVPLLLFEELKRRNAALHVPDSRMPDRLLQVGGSEPLAARAPDAESTPVMQPSASEHMHHHHHDTAGAAR
jgi:hypothetical protein